MLIDLIKEKITSFYLIPFGCSYPLRKIPRHVFYLIYMNSVYSYIYQEIVYKKGKTFIFL